MKISQDADAETAQRQPVATRSEKSPGGLAAVQSSALQLQADIDRAPRLLAQRRALDAAFGGAALQRQADGLEDDEPLQARVKPAAQLATFGDEDELPLQGRFKSEGLSVGAVQRQTDMLDEEAEPPVQARMDEAVSQRMAADEDDEALLQGRFEGAAVQRMEGASGSSDTPAATAAVPAATLNRTGMPNQLKAGIESLSGMDMSDVRVHRNSDRPAQLNALAYAQGNDIHLGLGQEQHLPHEAWHVVQQRQGRVKETVQMAGVRVNDDAGLEREADLRGAQAVFQGARTGANETEGHFVGTARATYDSLKSPVQCASFTNKLFGNAVSDTFIGLAGSVASVVSPVASGVPRHGPLTGRGFGTFVEAHLTHGAYAPGTRTGNAPDNTTWAALKLRRTANGEQMYVQGHLLNYHLGGLGDDWSNLIPLTQKANHRHSQVVEEAVKAKAADPTTEKVVYRVRPIYGSWPWQWPGSMVKMVTSPVVARLTGGAFGALAKLHEAEQHVPSELQCDWWVTTAGKTSAHSASIRQDYDDGKMRVMHEHQSRDMQNEEWVWGLLEQGIALALRYILLAGPLEAAARITIQAMTAEQLVYLLRRLRGEPKNALRILVDSRVSGAKAAAQLLCEQYGWGGMSALVLEVFGTHSGGTRDAPVSTSREMRHLNEDLKGEERELINNPTKRSRRPPAPWQ